MIGDPVEGGILIVCDHASNIVPADVDLGIPTELLCSHIAYDIGVAGVARHLATLSDSTAFLATNSRLVVDLNRDPDDDGAVAIVSDGIPIPGNVVHPLQRQQRLDRFFHPYHDKLEALIRARRPALILSIHSFTPFLKAKPYEVRPWEIGILYNENDVASKLALEWLKAEKLTVGDQLPYSGKILNASMNRHAEANAIAYVGIELRQDLVQTDADQERFAIILQRMTQFLMEKLA
jgi:predicted N-formylglutamate amidohydrolase